MDTRRGIVCGSLAENNKNLHVPGESRGIWIRATPRWKNKAVHFWYVHEIHCRGERYWQNEWWLYGAERPAAPYRRYKSSFAELVVFNAADMLLRAAFLRFPFCVIIQAQRDRAEIKSRRFGIFEETKNISGHTYRYSRGYNKQTKEFFIKFNA